MGSELEETRAGRGERRRREFPLACNEGVAPEGRRVRKVDESGGEGEGEGAEGV